MIDSANLRETESLKEMPMLIESAKVAIMMVDGGKPNYQVMLPDGKSVSAKALVDSLELQDKLRPEC